jgi:fumarate hydratase class II
MAIRPCFGKGGHEMDKTIATFKKNKFQEIRVGVREFKGNDLVDIRTWTMTQGSEDMVPTAKGVSINVQLFGELKKALAQVEDVLTENRMI